jgi:hypothetical protein
VKQWQRLIDVGMTLDDPGEDVGEVCHRIDVVEFAGLDERSDGGPMLRATIRTCEQCILSVERYWPFILPMSGRSRKSNTGIIHISAARSWCVAWSSERFAGAFEGGPPMAAATSRFQTISLSFCSFCRPFGALLVGGAVIIIRCHTGRNDSRRAKVLGNR